MDEFISGTEEYLKRLKELREQIEKRAQKKTIEEIYQQVFELLKSVTGKASNPAIIEEFQKMVGGGKFSSQHLKIINNIIAAKKEFGKEKSSLHAIDNIRREATTLINSLIEFSQRKDLAELDKRRMTIKYREKDKDKTAEVLVYDKELFLFEEGKIKKITDKISESNMEEVSKAAEQQKYKKAANISSEAFALLKKELGDFEILF